MMTGAEIVLILTFGVLSVAYALHRAQMDWSYRLRLICVFDMLEARESMWRPYDLFEVVLVDSSPAHSARSIAFARTDRRDDLIEFVLDRPLGERADLFAAWSTAATPLLCARYGNGSAVLQGPLDCFAGQVDPWPDAMAAGNS